MFIPLQAEKAALVQRTEMAKTQGFMESPDMKQVTVLYFIRGITDTAFTVLQALYEEGSISAADQV